MACGCWWWLAAVTLSHIAGDALEHHDRSSYENNVATSTFTIKTDDFNIEIDTDACLAKLIAEADADTGALSISESVPLLSLYNRVSDNRPTNMSPCSHVNVLESGILKVYAAETEYGSLVLNVTSADNPSRIRFEVLDTSEWTGDEVEKHIEFGEFWTGILDNRSTPYVMGQLQGPIAPPTSNLPSAGFLTVTENVYYKYIFYTIPGDAVVFAYIPPKTRISKVWNAVAKDSNLLPKSPNRYLTWLWTSYDFGEANRAQYAQAAKALGVDMIQISGWDTDYLSISNEKFPSGLRNTTQYLASMGIKLGLHMHPDIVWPCANSTGIQCLIDGVDISPIAVECPECLVPEGLAPTYRSGDRLNLRDEPTEDLGFWWCHEKKGSIAHNGNAKPCGQGSCNSRDWNISWGSDMHLVNTKWSSLGMYRNGGAVEFAGEDTSFGLVHNIEEFDTIKTGITLGLVAHTLSSKIAPLTALPVCLIRKNDSFSLCFGEDRHLIWEVLLNTSTESCTVTSNATLQEGTSTVIKATFNGSSGCLKLFFNNSFDSSCCNKPKTVIGLARSNFPIVFGARFSGAIEEVYLKNVSTENRVAYMYADDNRVLGTYLLDLSNTKGRNLFAQTVSTAVNSGAVTSVQYDGFEKLQLIAGRDFEHSRSTFTSGLWRGLPTPDWYHYEGWPLNWGQGVIKGIIQAHSMFDHDVAVECSFMAPGLGPWRPDMAPYVDERGDFVQLGLEWHPKMLYRIEQTGTMINPYDTSLERLNSTFEVDYWIGGLVTGGLPLQPIGSESSGSNPFTSRIKWWLDRYHQFGHVKEDGVTTLYFDQQCCHIEGICEWVACSDIVFVELEPFLVTERGSETQTNFGIYVGANIQFSVPVIPNNSTILLFQSLNTRKILMTLGKPSSFTITLVLLSPAKSSGLEMNGGLWSGEYDVQEVVKSSNGTIISHKTITASTSHIFISPQSSPDPGEMVTYSTVNH